MKRSIQISACILMGCISFYVFHLYKKNQVMPLVVVEHPIEKTATIEIKNHRLEVIIADTAQLRTEGLSGTTILPKEGMLFIFEQPGNYFFWMKDMNYPIDIVFFDDQKQIIGLFPDVLPSSYPQTVSSEKHAMYVLEVAPGFITKHTISIGDSFTLVSTK